MDNPWSGINFSVNNGLAVGTQFSNGAVISYQVTGKGNQPNALVYLEGFDTAAHGYQGYSFVANSNGQSGFQQINEKDLAFIGTIATRVQGINPIANYTSPNGLVYSSTNPSVTSLYGANGSYSFYWNDTANPNLYAYQQQAAQLSVVFDSTYLGWFWQPVFTGTGTSETIDPTCLLYTSPSPRD